jgi:hypothetical protein
VATSRRGIVVLAIAVAGCATARSGSTPTGAPLSLVAPDGTSATLDQLRADHDATVLVFWSGACPCVRRYQDRVDALLDAYPPRRVRVIGVSSNAGETHADALRVARERQVRISIFRDEGGAVARSLGAHSTPTIVVLDRSGAIRYRGWLDNERLPGDPGREAWLDKALVGLLDGEAFQSRSPTWGCTITRSLFESGSCGAHPNP